MGKEVGVGYWTNLRMSQLEGGFSPARQTTLAFIWYHMNSFYPFAGTPAMFGSGTTRGEHLQVRAEYSPNPAWKMYVHFESTRPGDFYAASRAPAFEVQAQVVYRLTFHPHGAGF